MTIHPPARLVGEPKKTKKKEGRKEGRKKDTRNSGKLAIRPDHPRRRIKTLHGGWPAVCSYTCQEWSKSVKGLRRCGGQKWPFPITLASGLYNSLYYRTSRDYRRLRYRAACDNINMKPASSQQQWFHGTDSQPQQWPHQALIPSRPRSWKLFAHSHLHHVLSVFIYL